MADDGINYQFTIDQKTAALDVAIGKIDQLIQSMSKANDVTAKHQQQNKKHEESFRGVGKAIDETKEKLNSFFQFVGAAVAFEILEKIGEKVIEIGRAALDAAAAAERMDLSFKLSLGAEGGEEMLGWLEKISGKTEFTDRQLKGWGKELVNAGIGAEEMDKYMAAALDVAAKNPDKMEGMSRAIMALSRASLTGKVDMRQLRGLSIGVEDLKTLPKFAGQSNDQIRKALKKGTIGKEDLLSLIAGPDKMLGDLGVKAGGTMQAKLTHLGELPDKFYAKLSKTDAFDKLGHAIDGILSKLDPDSPSGKKISGFLETAFSGGVDVVDSLSKAIDGIDFTELGVVFKEDVVPIVKSLVGLIDPFVELMERFFRGAERTREFFSAGPAFTPPALRNFKTGPFKTQAQEDESPSFLEPGPHAGKAQAWSGGMHMVGEEGGKALGGGLKQGAREELKIRSPSEVFAEIGEMSAAGFAVGMTRGGGRASAAMDSTLSIPAPRAGDVTRAGGMSISVGPVNITTGGDGAAAGHAAADAFATTLRAQLISILEQAQAEAGA